MVRGLRGRDDGDDKTNVQYKSNWNCHYEWPPLYNEYILKNLIKKKKDLKAEKSKIKAPADMVSAEVMFLCSSMRPS
jgi:hypothetical protein